jgi:hypothetical protein
MRIALTVVIGGVLAAPLGAAADVIRLADGQVVSGTIRSCQDGEVVVEPPAAMPVLVKIADISSGEGADIERCLGGRKVAADTVRGRWYGGQIVVAEIASLLVLPLAAAAAQSAFPQSSALGVLGLAGMLLSPAVLHAVHGNTGRAFGSLGIHVGLGGAGVLLGSTLTPCNGEEACPPLEAVGALIGLLASQAIATVVDVSSFAYEQQPSRLAVSVLSGEGRRPRTAPTGISLAVRF